MARLQGEIAIVVGGGPGGSTTSSLIDRDGTGRVCGLRYLDHTGTPRRATASFVVDASGHTSKIHNEVGGKKKGGSDLEEFLDLVGGMTSGEFTPASQSASRMGRISSAAKTIEAAAVDADEVGDAHCVLESTLLSEVLTEGARLSARAALGDLAKRESPLFDGGLIPSANSRQWIEFPIACLPLVHLTMPAIVFA